MNFLYFSSNAKYPYFKLSNFNECKINGNVNRIEYIFPSSEHYYMAHFFENPEILSINGKYGNIDALKYFYKTQEIADKKIKYWGKKNNIGIVAKMLKNNPGNLTLKNIDSKEKIWNKVLLNKYMDNKEHRNILLSTRGNVLVEFSRNAKEDSFYHGKIVDDKIIGNNYMGKKMMEMRDIF